MSLRVSRVVCKRHVTKKEAVMKKKLPETRTYSVSVIVEVADENKRAHFVAGHTDEEYIKQEIGWSAQSFKDFGRICVRRIG
jgi:hypothetical protein